MSSGPCWIFPSPLGREPHWRVISRPEMGVDEVFFRRRLFRRRPKRPEELLQVREATDPKAAGSMAGDSSGRRLGPGWAQRVLYAASLAVGANFAVLFFPQVPELHAQGLVVSPHRVVFEGRTRSAQVFLINSGTRPATYRISFKNMRMLEDGSYEDIEVPRPGERFADEMIRYAPRQVVLEPDNRQIVRLLVRKPRDLAPGEYRSHLSLLALPAEESGTDIEAAVLKPGEARVQIAVLLAVTIPVIVRHGDLSATVTLSNLALKSPESPGGPPVLSLRFNRHGDRSVYGDIVVTFKPDAGEDTEVGVVRGVAVFTPNLTRILQITLRLPNEVTLRGGRLHVAYRERLDEGGAVLVLAEADIPVP